jgi:hypothetical protein
MRRSFVGLLVGVLASSILGLGIAQSKETPPVAQGVHTALNLAEYQLPGNPANPLSCGEHVVTQTWVVAKFFSWADVAGTANVTVNTFYGDEVIPPGKTHQPKFDRIGIKADLATNPKQVGDFDWFNSPEDDGEEYTWQFDVVANGVLQSTCEIYVTRI